MKENNTVEQLNTIQDFAIKALQQKKGQAIVLLKLDHLDVAPTNYFVICHATSDRHAESLAEAVEEKIYEQKGEEPWHKEGFENKEWILLDYINVVVHIFLKEKRDFYSLEDLWIDAEREDYNE